MSTTSLDPHRIVTTTDRPAWKLDALPFDTLAKMFWQRVAENGHQVMMRQKDLGIWRSYSWAQVGTTRSEEHTS